MTRSGMYGNDHLMRGIVNRMRDERIRRGWTAADLSVKLARLGYDLPRLVIVNLENRRRGHIAIGEVIGLARVFTTTMEWLVYGVGRACLTCDDKPPAGFTCNDCGKSTSAKVQDILDQSVFQQMYVSGRG